MDAGVTRYVQITAPSCMQKQHRLTPEEERARKQLAKKARKQPVRREGIHRVEKNKDGTYRCLTCLKKERR